MRPRSFKTFRRRYEGTKQAYAILRAARAVFIRDGAAGFSARRVAKEAGLSLGSVQHVFPTVDALLVAMFEYVSASYDERYAEVLLELPLNARARWAAIVDFLVNDIFNQNTRRFFFGFWALSNYNPFVGTLLKEGYIHQIDNLAPFIANIRPDLGDEKCRAIARQVAALIEGWMVFTSADLSPASRNQLRRTLKEGIDTLVVGTTPSTHTRHPR